MSEANAQNSHEAPQQKRAEPLAQPAALVHGAAEQAVGVALLERGSVAAPPSLPSEVLRRSTVSQRGLGPSSIDLMLRVQRLHGNRQTAGALSHVRATAEPTLSDPASGDLTAAPGNETQTGDLPRARLSAAQPRTLPSGPTIVQQGTQVSTGEASPLVARFSLAGSATGIIRRDAVPGLVAPPKVAPAQDPKFVAVKGAVGKVAGQEKEHPTAAKKAAEAQAAATGPANEVASKAAANQVEQMGAKEPGAFDKKAFVEAVKAAIAKIAPKNQAEADEFKGSGKAGQVKGEVAGMVTKGKEGAETPIKETAQAAPNPAGAAPKPVTPMPPEQAGPPPAPVNAAAGMPAPRPPEQTNLAGGPAETDKMMSDAGVTEKQLTKSNEPQFQQAADAKKKLDTQAATAPTAVKAEEQVQLGKAGAAATATATASTSAMHQHRAGVLGAVQGGKSGAKAKDEGKRAEVATKLEGIYTQTKTEVTAILTGLDAKVNSAFDAGEGRARAAFESYVDGQMRAYKDKRYSGLDGAAQWVIDKFTGLPPEVNAFYTQGRDLYLQQMDGVINTVAGIVETELNRAKARAAKGKKEIADAVNALPKNLQAIGKEVQGELSEKFAQLDQEINAKQDELVQGLAEKYAAARDAVDERINAMQAENKGLFDAAKNAIGGVIETIKNLKEMLLGVLKRAAGAIDKIIDDPIQFLSNLVSAIKQGLMKFVGNIGKHLKDGLMGWLLGELAAAGIRMPKSLDFMGILDLVLQVMGLTYDAIRARAVKIVGEPTVKRIEQVAEVFKVLITEGPAGLWKWIVDKVDNLVDTVLGGIKDLVITKVITAGITWLISMLNPASAFVKACKMIYDVIMFFVERGSQIMELVNAIVDSVEAIASGALEGAATWIENALAKALPVAISFLASLLGLGGLSEKIKKIIEEVQKPVGKAVDAVINTVVKGFKKVAGFVGGLFGKGKDKDKEKGQADDRTPGQKDQAEKQAAQEAEKLLKAPHATPDNVRKGLPGIKTAFKLSTIDLKKEGENRFRVHTEIQRADSDAVELGTDNLDPEKILDESWDEIVAKAGGLNPPGAKTRLSKSAGDFNWRVLKEWIVKSPFKEGRAGAEQTVRERIDRATGNDPNLDGDRVYQLLLEAARAVKELYPEGALNTNVHHGDRVKANPATFEKTRMERSKAKVKKLLAGMKPQPGETAEQLRVRICDIANEVVKGQVETEKEGAPAVLSEVEMIVVVSSAHHAIHREEKRQQQRDDEFTDKFKLG